MRIVCIAMLAALLTPLQSDASQVQTNPNDIEATRIFFSGSANCALGAHVSSAGDFDGDGFNDFAIGAPDFDVAKLDRLNENGAVFIVKGSAFEQKIKTLDLSNADSPAFVVTGTPDRQIGFSFASPGDIDADGFADMAFATPSGDAGFIVYGSQAPERIISLAERQSRTILIHHAGTNTAATGDFNGDGYPDMIFGNPESETVTSGLSEYTVGDYAVIFGSAFLPEEIDAHVPDPTHFRDRGNADARLGEQVTGNLDLNADGFSDFIALAPNDGPDHNGRAYVVYGNENNFRDNRAEYSFVIENAKHSIQALGDTNGDGFPEFAVGISEDRVLVVKGGNHLKGTMKLQEKMDERWGTTILGAHAAYPAGDLNGDGFADIAVAMPNAQVGEKLLAGKVLLLFGKSQLPAQIDVNALVKGFALPIDYILIDGLNAFDTFGASVAAVGDIQGDGFDDILIGAPTVALPGDALDSRPGSAYLISGVNLYYALQTHRSAFTQEPSTPRQ